MTRSSATPRMGATLIAVTTAALLNVGSAASAAIVPTVPLGTLTGYVVLGATTVTNTGSSVLNGNLGLSPGTSITGFPPGLVNGTVSNANGPALQAQSDLTAAYVNAAGRGLTATTTAELGNLTLVGGVYAGPSKAALSLTGPLTLDGGGDPNSVFIFQTDSTLTTASASSVNLINGAQECNVFWLIGSSATLGTNSSFVGTILALTSITVTTNVTVHGRALARNGAVTLDSDVFTLPTCNLSVPSTTTTLGGTTTTGLGGTTTTGPGGTTAAGGATTTMAGGSGTTAPPITGLPFTGSPIGPTVVMAVLAFAIGGGLMVRSRMLKD
jgi:hypothetical protein